VCFYTVYVDSRLRHNRARLFEIERGSIVTSMPLAAVRVFVRNLEEAIGFYKRNFDWPMTGGGASEGCGVFDVGDVNLVIEPVAADADEEDQAYVGRFTGI
jgi:hypothetical protein